MKVKTVIIYTVAVLFLLSFFYVFSGAFHDISPPVTSSESFSQALWSTWGATIIIVSFILFAGGAGILVLLGGGWRWE